MEAYYQNIFRLILSYFIHSTSLLAAHCHCYLFPFTKSSQFPRPSLLTLNNFIIFILNPSFPQTQNNRYFHPNLNLPLLLIIPKTFHQFQNKTHFLYHNKIYLLKSFSIPKMRFCHHCLHRIAGKLIIIYPVSNKDSFASWQR